MHAKCLGIHDREFLDILRLVLFWSFLRNVFVQPLSETYTRTILTECSRRGIFAPADKGGENA